jgi:hypothetical protein
VSELRVEFDVEVGDLVAAGMAAAHQGGVLRRTRHVRLFWGAVCTGMGVAAVVLTMDAGPAALGWAAFAMLAVVLGFWNLVQGALTTRSYRNSLERGYADCEPRGLVGRCVVAARADGLHASWPGGTYQHPWRAVFWVRTDHEYAFVAAVSSVFPVPRWAFPDDASFHEFVAVVRGAIEQHSRAVGG